MKGKRLVQVGLLALGLISSTLVAQARSKEADYIAASRRMLDLTLQVVEAGRIH